jgi:hypothetical protein
MTANQNHNQYFSNSIKLIKSLSDKDQPISKLHNDQISSFKEYSDLSPNHKIDRTLERLKYFEELEFQKILIMRVLNKDEKSE